MSRQRITVGLTVLALIAAIAVLAIDVERWGATDLLSAPEATDTPVVISEFVSSNGSVGVDEDGDNSDWIELHNPSEDPADLGGFHLSDDADRPDRWRLPDVTIGPGGYLLVWASGKDRTDPDGELHTSFRIGQDGGEVLLTAPDGWNVIDRLGPVTVPRDASYGRDPGDHARTCFFAVPTLGRDNAAECFDDDTLGAPTLSVPSGFYDGAFALEIDVDREDATVIYTLDGSYPDLEDNPDRTLVYDHPLRIEDRTPQPERLATIDPVLPTDAIEQDLPTPTPTFDEPIQKATVVRARTPYSAESVATYFVGPDMVRDDLPVLSLVLDENHLFDHDTGIYVAGHVFEEHQRSDEFDPTASIGTIPANYTQRGRAWERPFEHDLRDAVHLEHCAPGGICDLQRRVGVRIHGGASRSFHQKSLRLYARNDYSSRTFRYPFFGDRAPADQRRLILRNGGQEQRNTMLLDAYMQELMRHLEPDTQAYQPSVVFINGEYWGIHNIRERYDVHYLELVHGADPDHTVVFEGGLRFDRHGREFLETIVDRDPTDPSTVELAESTLDLDSLIDFVIAHTFAGNTDWPGNNERLWREPDGPDAPGEGVRDGRWRWLIFDVDSVGGWGASDPDLNVWDRNFAPTDDIAAHGGLPLLFHHLMGNEGVRHRFLARFTDQLNTAFHPERALRVLDEVAAGIEDEMPRHLDRWQTIDVDTWHARIDRVRDFIEVRPERQRAHLVDHFDLEGTATVAVAADPSQGFVRVNTVTVDPSTPGVDDASAWEGVYFEGLPVEVEAVPLAGHRFVRWEGAPEGRSEDPVVEIVPDGDVALTAVFATD